MTALRGCRHLRVINRSTESPMFAVFDFASFEVSPDRWRQDTREEGMTEGGRSWYVGPETAAALISATRRVRCTLRMADRIIDRWMDGGKGEKGSFSIRAPSSPAVPFLSFSLLAPLHSLFAVLFLSLSLLLSWKPSLSSSLLSSVTCSSAPLSFHYLIKSSYDEKDEDPTRGSVVVLPFVFTGHRSGHARARETGE